MTKNERLEIRLDEETLIALDEWREKQNTMVSRGEAIRQLILSGISSNNKQMFQLMRLQILALACNPTTADLISPSHAFAWEYGVYPFHRSEQEAWAEPFANQFDVPPAKMEALALFLDNLWLKRKTITFYELENHYRVRERNAEWSRGELVAACQYMYLEKMFDDNFWAALLKDAEHPIEASGITKSYEPKEEIFFG